MSFLQQACKKVTVPDFAFVSCSGNQTKSPSPGKFHPFDFKDDSDSDHDQLIVDETPRKRAPRPPPAPMTPFQQAHEARTGGLKLKLTSKRFIY
jgi:hypothetical protein